MHIYIITFYAHFGAVRYRKACEKAGLAARLMPVPRQLSSSCGTCVRCENSYLPAEGVHADEIEQIAEKTGETYRVIYRAEG